MLKTPVRKQTEEETGSLSCPWNRRQPCKRTSCCKPTPCSGGTVLLCLEGELDIATAPLLDRAVTSILAAGPDLLCLDLTALAFCDMTGLHALRRLTDQTHAAHTHLHLTGLHPRLRCTLARLKTLSLLDPARPPGLTRGDCCGSARKGPVRAAGLTGADRRHDPGAQSGPGPASTWSIR
ncbi:STAS domain-containing protein [Streptomyces sp. NBC_00233]|uniref:STAS domain-containing protein n=1 Tax=Streptomyces sp. NBC_00233 TaxID=2975686 RepID=UPI00338E3434